MVGALLSFNPKTEVVGQYQFHPSRVSGRTRGTVITYELNVGSSIDRLRDSGALPIVLRNRHLAHTFIIDNFFQLIEM